jgi:predicted AlkP superfamily phosphohydrolase/phosphomutase
MRNRHVAICGALLFLILMIEPSPAWAYIGPGAGFAFLSSFLMLFLSFFMAFFTLLTWPLRVLIRFFKRRKALANSKTNRVIILGLDGLEPTITERLMAEGRLPNLQRLAKQGHYGHLQSTYPSISPVAWSTFATGVCAGGHNIFDFLSRDKKSYLPELSSSSVGEAKRVLALGKYQIPIGKPIIKFLRRSQSFWKILGDHGIFSHVLRVPISFPPEKLNGALLSAMCTPDIRGTQGEFSYYATDRSVNPQMIGGQTTVVERRGKTIESFIKGPQNSILKEKTDLKCPFVVTLVDNQRVDIKFSNGKHRLKIGEYSDWLELEFKAGLGIKVRGIARFLVKSIEPEFKLYVTPINIDPEKPALPISYPFFYSVYLAKLFGKYATLGLAEDTWALNEQVIDDDDFLTQSYLIHEEREKQFMHALDNTKQGLCAVVVDATDRIQHMFFRYLEDGHPALNGHDVKKYANVIDELYMKMDNLVGRTMAKTNDGDVLFVISDHGFKSFRRGINLNSWLHQNDYLALKEGGESGDYFKNVDWSRTKAYAIGLAGIYLNQKGREAKGIVNPGDEVKQLKRELIAKLSGLKDAERNEAGIVEAFDSQKVYKGPYTSNGPDILIGYNVGYRISWDGATGKVTDVVFEDNKKAWSGDHCIDPRLVPGVIFCNQKVTMTKPGLIDMAPTMLDLFGVPIPGYMEGKSIFSDGVVDATNNNRAMTGDSTKLNVKKESAAEVVSEL